MRDAGLGSWPARRRRAGPDAVAVRFAENALTYAELDERVNKLAHALLDRGIERGDRVASLSVNCPTVLELLFAVARIGAVYVPLNTRLADAETAAQLADCRPKLLVHDAAHAAIATEVLPYRAFGPDGYAELVAAGSDAPIDEPIELEQPFVIMYTSGTTGTPKGVVLSHANLTWNAVNVLIDVDLAADEVALIVTPLFHSAALSMNALPVLLKGGTVVLAESTVPEHILGLVERWSVTHLQGVPTLYRSLVNSPRWATSELGSLRRVVSGGSAAPASLITRFADRGIRFSQGYGMTETGPGALYLGSARAADKIGSVGRPMFFTDVRTVDGWGHPLAPGARGELVVQGPNVMLGYWNRADETRAAFTPDGWYRSGDVGTFDDDGDAYVVDRVKDMFISGGENVYPAEVEAALLQHPAVVDCAVIAQPHERWGEVGRAVLVTDRPVDPNDIRSFVATRLAKYKVPAEVVVVSELPRNASGKLLKSLVRARWGAETTGTGEPVPHDNAHAAAHQDALHTTEPPR